MMTGSCLCGAISWQFGSEFSQVTHCHCRLCRKAHGSPYATYGVGPISAFEYLSGTELIAEFESSPNFIRSFCRDCGSVIPNTKLGDIVAIPIGGMDGDLELTIDAHIYVADMAPWFEITDELPRYDYYPNQDSPVVAFEESSENARDAAHGSCMCQSVKYEITAQFDAVRHCHCSRCRKARAAAHSTNGVSAIAALNFIEGRDLVREYRLPSAAYFGQWFCAKCGSATPRIDTGRDIALTPFGGLDGEPGQRPQAHIFVRSKANWDEITDGLNQFEEMPPA